MIKINLLYCRESTILKCKHKKNALVIPHPIHLTPNMFFIKQTDFPSIT